MTLYGVGLGPGDPGLLTVRSREALESAETVFCPGRLAESLAAEYVPESRLTRLTFPMTDDRDELEAAWADAASTVAPRARESDVAFGTIGDPNVYSTFGHLRRTLAAEFPEVSIEVIPGVSVITAFANAFDVEIDSGGTFGIREAPGGAAPTGPDRLLLLKVTDAEATQEGLVSAGYQVRYGRRLFIGGEEGVVTDDPAELGDDDYYTIAYAERDGPVNRTQTTTETCHE